MSCSSCGCNPCNEVTCDASNEPLASALNNFITAFFGTLTKTCVNDRVVWVLPCDLDSGFAGYPRVAGEGLACYFLRVFENVSAGAKVKVTDADTTPGNLSDKIAAGDGIDLTVLNTGGNEQLEISSEGTVKVTTNDTTAGFLSDKIIEGTGIDLAVINPGGNEQLEVSSECLVFVSATDVAPAFLDSKVVAGNEITATILNPGGVEQLEIAYTIPPSFSIPASNIDWSLSYTFRKTLGANTTFTFTNEQDGKTIVVAITNTAGNFTAGWPVAVQWANGSQPVLTLGAKTDVFTFVNFNGITYGSVVANMS